MGRGSSNNTMASATLRQGGEGEVQSLYDNDDVSVTQLDEHSGVAARSSIGGGYGTDDDGRADASAIRNLARQLKPKNPGMSNDELTDRAESVYAQFCQRIITGQLHGPALQQFAALIGEDPAQLRERLADSE